MKKSNDILEFAYKNEGIVTTQMISEAGVSRGSLKYLVDSGKLDKVSRGVYVVPGTWEDEFVSIQTKYKRGVYSLGTALYLLDLTDRTPLDYEMTFPTGYNLSHVKEEGIRCISMKKELYNLGIIETMTPSGHIVRSYNAEKTLCDILRPHNHVDIDIITNAFKRYVLLEEKNINLLSEYAQLLRVEKKVKTYLEVLL